MAGDWIKMRTDIYRDPKVCIMADLLLDEDGPLARYVSHSCMRDMTVTRNVTRNVTVGALVTVWGVTRHRGKRNGDDLFIAGATSSIVDDIADLPGFGAAMIAVGWAIETDDGLVFPHFFEEFNVEPTEERKANNAERQRRYREKRNALRDVTVTSQSNAREEKRREENTNKYSRFVKPTVDEVASYATSQGLVDFSAIQFVAFYESKEWKVGKNTMKNWKAAVTGWAARDAEKKKTGTQAPKRMARPLTPEELASWTPTGVPD